MPAPRDSLPPEIPQHEVRLRRVASTTSVTEDVEQRSWLIPQLFDKQLVIVQRSASNAGRLFRVPAGRDANGGLSAGSRAFSHFAAEAGLAFYSMSIVVVAFKRESLPSSVPSVSSRRSASRANDISSTLTMMSVGLRSTLALPSVTPYEPSLVRVLDTATRQPIEVGGKELVAFLFVELVLEVRLIYCRKIGGAAQVLQVLGTLVVPRL